MPIARSQVFSTFADNQNGVEVKLWLGEAPLLRNNVRIGAFHLENIPPAKAGVPKIKVEYVVDQKCGVTGRANLIGSNLSIEQHFDPPIELSDENIQKLISDAEQSQEEDDAGLREVEAINRANALIRKAEERFIDGRGNGEISAAIADLGLGLASNDAAVIREKSDILEGLLASNLDPFEIFSSAFSPDASRKKSSASHVRPPKAKESVTVSAPPQSLGKIFGGAKFTLDPGLCFVLMPFDETFRPLYDDQIKPTIEEAGLRSERADDIHGAGLITWDIWEHINRARFLIADLTGRNPNVFYELGLAHALSKDVILITQSMDFVPFDLKTVRCICYNYTPRGAEKLASALKATIATLIAAG